MNRKYLIFFCFLISPTSGFGQIVLHDENELIEVTQFEYFIDTTARLDLNEVLKDNSDENFINYNNDNQIEINPNYTYWIRFSLLIIVIFCNSGFLIFTIGPMLQYMKYLVTKR